MDKDKKSFYFSVLATVIILIVVGLVLFAISKSFNSFESTEASKEINSSWDDLIGGEEENLAMRLIDGVKVPLGEENHFPVAVMIENHEDARPQSGLSKANLVFEAPVEGGITRFMAVYTDYAEIPEIGPIRSARPYYLDWLQAFDALYMHVGGSPEALEKIHAQSIRDLDQFYLGQFYWRSKNRYAPHNVYTSGKLIQKGLEYRDIEKETKGNFQPWKYKEELTEEDIPESTENKFIDPDEEFFIDNREEARGLKDLVIRFSPDPNYQVRWKYSEENNEYLRYHGVREKHKDADGTHIASKNIVVMATEITVIDDVGRRKIKTLGTGDAWIFSDGEVILAKWEKLTRKSRIKFLVEGEEFSFLPGTTWVEVISDTLDLEY